MVTAGFVGAVDPVAALVEAAEVVAAPDPLAGAAGAVEAVEEPALPELGSEEPPEPDWPGQGLGQPPAQSDEPPARGGLPPFMRRPPQGSLLQYPDCVDWPGAPGPP